MDICPDAVPSFLRYFDLSVAPPLLFYAYIPAIIVALFFGFYIFKKDNHSLQSKLLLGIALFFSIWVFNLIFQWTIAYVKVDMFSWQITPFFEILIPILSIYFVYVFLNKKDILLSAKIIFSFFILTLAITLPTQFTALSFDYQNCQANYGDVYYHFVYIFELLAIFIVGYICIKKYLETAKEDRSTRGQALILAGGSILFLTIFYLSNILGEITKTYQINLFGPIGILAFIGFISFMIVRYHTFNIKLFATQALVIGTAILIGSQLFNTTSILDFYVTAATSIAFLISGVFLIRSVKKEIEQREHIEVLATELEKTNERQEGLLHFVGHEVKGFLTKDMSAFAAISQGDFGAPPDGMKPFVDRALEQSRDGVRSVSDILTASNQKKGTMTYAKEPFDLKALVTEIMEKERPLAEEKGLALTFSAGEDGTPYIFSGDREKIGDNVFRNVIENSIHYTPSGSITASLKRENGKFIFAITDTGVGITEEDKKRLFTEGGHGKDSQTVNAHSTGYGLYIAKNIVEAHGGTIRADSDGAGKGSTFTVEFPSVA